MARGRTWVDLLGERASSCPDHTIFTFLVDGETQETALTYGQLDQRARAVAALLQRQDMVGARALLLYPPGLEFLVAFFGCLYAGVTSIPAPSLHGGRLKRNLDQLTAMTVDARPALLLTTSSVARAIDGTAKLTPEIGLLPRVPTGAIDPALAAEWIHPEVGLDTVAVVQYTSGSTSVPRGVVLTHGNLLHNSELIHRNFRTTAAVRGVCWLPHYHDMGLGALLHAAYANGSVTLMSPTHFLQRPLRWLQAISRTQATISGGPNFAYDLCVQRIGEDQRATLDLRSWDLAFNASEPVRPDTLERFAAAFSSCGFRREAFHPCYGLAEATTFVSGHTRNTPLIVRTFRSDALARDRAIPGPDAPTSRRLVAVGKDSGDLQIAIVDPTARTRCGPGEVGEVWVSGSSVARGYWARPEESDIAFRAFVTDTGEGPFLRTGDLGFLHEDALFIVGRLKDVIIVRGANYYPHDIELTVEECHRGLRQSCGAAFSVEASNQEGLVIVHEVKRDYRGDCAAIIAAIRRAVVADHGLEVHAVALLKPGTIDRTSSGKIQRNACRAAFLRGTLPSVADWRQTAVTPLDPSGAHGDRAPAARDALLSAPPESRREMLETYVRSELMRVLGLSVSSDSMDDPLTALGLDSLMAAQLKNRLEYDLGVTLPLVEILEEPTLTRIVTSALDQLAGRPGDRPALVIADTDPVLVARLLDELEQISDEQARALLAAEQQPLEREPGDG